MNTPACTKEESKKRKSDIGELKQDRNKERKTKSKKERTRKKPEGRHWRHTERRGSPGGPTLNTYGTGKAHVIMMMAVHS